MFFLEFAIFTFPMKGQKADSIKTSSILSNSLILKENVVLVQASNKTCLSNLLLKAAAEEFFLF